VPGTDRVGDIVVNSSVVGGGIAFSEEVALHRCVRRTQPFPINLIEVIRFKNEAANDTRARGSLHHGVDLSEEDVLVARNSWGFSDFADGELSAICSVGQRGSFS
jgi:hypothetical protein